VLLPVGPNPGRHLGKFQMAVISATGRPIDFVFDSRVGFSRTADQMDLLSVVPNPRFNLPPTWKISNDHNLWNELSDPLS